MTFWFQNSAQYEKTLVKLGISEKEYLDIINVVLQTFPKDWIDSELAEINKRSNFFHYQLWPAFISGLRYNPIPIVLARGGGFMAIAQITRLGRLIRKAEQLPNRKEVIKKLKGKADDYISTLFELETLEFFSESGFRLCGPPENDGIDYTFLKNGQKIFVEATHRGISWCVEIFKRLGESIGGVQSKKFKKCIRLDYSKARRFVSSNSIEELVYDIDKIIAKTPEKNHTIEDKECRFYVEFKESENGGLTLKWHETPDYLYEVVELFKGRLNEKRKQLCQNDFSFCSIDMRSLVHPFKKDREDMVRSCITCMKRIFSVARDFLSENRSVAGIFVWIKHYGRSKDIVIDSLNADETILIKADSKLSDSTARKMFPLAVLQKDFPQHCE